MSGFDLHLTDKVFLVAGASEGLGFATAKTLAEMGANVSICARRQDILSNAAQRIRVATGREVFPYGGDLTDPEFPGCWVEAVVGRWKRIDGVFTNNGGPPSGTFESFFDDAWEDAMALTLMPAVRLVREALPYLKRKNGVVLHSVSMSVRQPISGLLLSNAMRQAVVGMAKTQADEFGPMGIRVNCIAPGLFSTGRLEEVLRKQSAAARIPLGEHKEKSQAAIPLRRFGDPKEFADLAAFLLSDRSSYMTGQTVVLDGGMARAY